MSVIRRILTEHRIYSTVERITRDPDPAPDHEYQRDPHSGAGNCVCGGVERHRRHPHEFMGCDSEPARCTCGLPQAARVHRATDERPATSALPCPTSGRRMDGRRG